MEYLVGFIVGWNAAWILAIAISKYFDRRRLKMLDALSAEYKLPPR